MPSQQRISMNRLITTAFVIFVLVLRIKCDICDVCACVQSDCASENRTVDSACVNQPSEYFLCDGNDRKFKETEKRLDLNSIQWPNRNTTVSATFNHFKLTYLTNLLCSASKSKLMPTLIAINLESNAIEHIVQDPFEYCKNLTSISIACNHIERLPTALFESTHSLERLNISHNTLSEFDGGILSHCKQIIELDLSHNQITILKLNEILDASPNIETINAAFNLLFAISDNNQNKYLRLRRLNLAGNKMTVITSNTFLSYRALEYINVSANILGNIEPNAFEGFEALQTLDLSSNQLKNLALILTESIEYISLAKNQLKYWPIKKLPANLQTLELQENELIEMFDSANKNKVEIASLKYLNISRNHINMLPSTLHCPMLEVFDASYNEFNNIPQYLGKQAPVLKVLKLRGNPIKTIEFTTKMSAHIFDLSELPLLTEFDASVFNSIVFPKNGPNQQTEPKEDCVELTISHNPALKVIKNSFERIPNLCRLDLSYNNLQIIDHNWMNWSALHRGIDLQGNPIDCSCASQWLVDYLVPMLYKHRKDHHYLMELRCVTPERFRGHRIVRYLDHVDAFCLSEVSQAKFGLYRHKNSDVDQENEFLWYKGFGLLLTIALVIVIILTSTCIIVILIRRCREKRKIHKKNNRRFNDAGVL